MRITACNSAFWLAISSRVSSDSAALAERALTKLCLAGSSAPSLKSSNTPTRWSPRLNSGTAKASNPAKASLRPACLRSSVPKRPAVAFLAAMASASNRGTFASGSSGSGGRGVSCSPMRNTPGISASPRTLAR